MDGTQESVLGIKDQGAARLDGTRGALWQNS